MNASWLAVFPGTTVVNGLQRSNIDVETDRSQRRNALIGVHRLGRAKRCSRIDG
jgi:hypothetical protein